MRFGGGVCVENIFKRTPRPLGASRPLDSFKVVGISWILTVLQQYRVMRHNLWTVFFLLTLYGYINMSFYDRHF